MKVLRYTLSILFLSLAAVMACAVESADAILRNAADKLAAAGSVEVRFTVNGGEGPIAGTATIEGARFVFDTPVIEVWFDGTTQWTLLKGSDEVSITEPTSDELMESNPFAILTNYSGTYRARRLPDINGHRRVQLTPHRASDTDITGAVIHIGADGWPAAAEVNFNGNRSISATVQSVTAGSSHPVAFYRFNPAAHPGTSTIDLR